MASKAAAQIITKAAAEAFNSEVMGGGGSKVNYSLEYSNPREYSENETLGRLTFNLKNPIAEDEAEAVAQELLPGLSDVVGDNVSGKVVAALMAKAGTTQKLRDNVESSFYAQFSSDIATDTGQSVNALIRSSAGRLVTRNNMRTILDRLMKEHLLSSMSVPSAGTGRNTPLRNRTGRFLTSATLNDVVIGARGESLSLYYSYMVYPYQVFDPKNTESPDSGLASRRRNPQKLIGDALLKAARTQLSEKYKVFIRQVE